MNLSDAGESRIRGYLFMLESSLRAFMRRDIVADAVREVESHIRERVGETDAMPNEGDALNRLLDQLGPPHRLARAYAAEIAVEEAVSTGRIGATARALFALAANTTRGFFVGVALFMGYLVGGCALLVAVLKPILPNNVGVVTDDGFRGVGVFVGLPPEAHVAYGWWLMLIAGAFGIVVLRLTHSGAKAYLSRVRARRQLGGQPLA